MNKVIYVISIVIFAYIWRKYVNEGCVCESTKSLEGKTVILTGGNAGVGKATAIEIAKRKGHLIIASRNVEKSLAARDEIIQETGHNDIEVMKLDLGDLDSVAEFANEVLAKEKYIDYLVNNAGVLLASGATKQGFGKVFGINHVGHFLLTNLLLERMKEQSSTRPVRIINVSSAGYAFGSTDFENAHVEPPMAEGFKDIFRVYGTSKLANVYFSSELAKQVDGFDITTYSLHPGSVESDIGSDLIPHLPDTWLNYIKFKVLNVLVQPLLMNGFYGAQTTMASMLDDSAAHINGAYFEQCTSKQLMELATDENVGRLLWDHSVKLVQPWLDRSI